MSATSNPRLPFGEADQELPPAVLPDAPSRARAVDPASNVVLEASAGTGKTRVLVERYVNLLRAGVDPDHILAITFTRKAAAEMRERIIDRLREASRLSHIDLATWRSMKERLGDIAISTIDAFCLSLVREFPLECDVDPGFDLADEAQVPRLVAEALDQALRISRSIAREDDDVALVFAQLGERRLRKGIEALLARRLVAPQTLRAYLHAGPKDLSAAVACRRAAEMLRDVLTRGQGGARGREEIVAFLDAGPTHHPQFAMLAADLKAFCAQDPLDPLSPLSNDDPFEERTGQAAFRALLDRTRAYFLTQDGRPRTGNFSGHGFKAEHCSSDAGWKRHRLIAVEIAPGVADVVKRFRRDLNIVMSRGVWRVFAVALGQYQRTLESHALLDFSGVLEKAVGLLREMDEFAESRFRLEARHRHVLVDEFQDTSRPQWALVAELVRSWGEGLGTGADGLPPSIFIVADRKQSIYGFRDADVAILDEAAAFIERLRPEGDPRRAISVSFRAVPGLLRFVNDIFSEIVRDETAATSRKDGFRYDERDRFPGVPDGPDVPAGGAAYDEVAFIAGDSVGDAAERVAAEMSRLLKDPVDGLVRDRVTGVRRQAEPADMAVLFRSRDSHREFEKALERQGVLTYVYKGLGFFEADEVQDAVALLRYLADPLSNLRAAALLRSRLVRVSDPGIARLGAELASAVVDGAPPGATDLSGEDRDVLAHLNAAVPRWLAAVDRLPPSDLLTMIFAETAYACELRGPHDRQARENLKKLRSMIRRFQNRGYATLARVAEHLDELAVGDESNAAIDATGAVSLMTVHAAKGLEFPIVFVVNMGRGTGTQRPPIRVSADGAGEPSVAIADFQSEADEDSVAREREETKRLLYVAVTRARDRLYLSGTVQNGAFRTGRGSLGEVLPAAVKKRLLGM